MSTRHSPHNPEQRHRNDALPHRDAPIMNPVSTRCRLEGRILPGACFGLVVSGILTKVILGLSRHRDLDILDLLIQLALAAGLFRLIVAGRSSLWTIVEVPGGIRMERDGTVLYEGLSGGIQIVDEDRGIMTLRAGGGPSFQFPRRRAFHKILSRIAVRQQPSGEDGVPPVGVGRAAAGITPGTRLPASASPPSPPDRRDGRLP